MLIIRQAQITLFQQLALRQFEDRVIAHLQASFPDMLADLGEAGTRALVGDATRHAQQYGFETERDITLFIDLALVLGPQFDELPWAAEILHDKFILDPTVRIDTLYECALQHGE